LATTPGGGADRTEPHRRRGILGSRPIALSVLVLVAAAGVSLAFLLTQSKPSPPGEADASATATGLSSVTPSGAEPTPDFRFLPALTQPQVLPTPTPAPPVPSGSLAVSLAEQAKAPTDAAALWISWTGPDGKPIESGASIKAGIDDGTLRALAIARDATRILRSAQTGHDYVYRLDTAGASGSAGSSAVTAFRLRSIDDTDSSLVFKGAWAAAGFPGYLGRSARFSETPGDVATFTFSGRSVAWIGPVGPGRGEASIRVDGADAGTVSQAAAHYDPRRVLFVRSWPASGQHEIRITVAGHRGAAVMIDSFTVVGPPDHPPAETDTPTPTPGQTLPSATLPLRAAFYYGWYPEAWRQQGSETYSTFHPTATYYDSSDPKLLAGQIQAMRYGGIGAGIASWWGAGTRTDGRMSQLLTAARGTDLVWAVNDEVEEVADPDSAAIETTLRYIDDHYANDPAYLRIGGRFVVFVGAGATDGCDMVERWTKANTVQAYLVLPTVANHAACASQPDEWYGPDPTLGDQQVGQSSYAISAGFWRLGEASRLARDLERWSRSIKAMIGSGARLQLIDSFNQWGDGSSVESASEWASASGYGGYLDALHDNGAGNPAASGPPSGSPLPSDGQADAVLVGAGAIASCTSTNDEETAQLLSTVDGTVFTVGDNAFDSGTIDEYRNCYGPSWGTFRDRTRPAAGTREYVTDGAAGYFTYFGAAAGDPDKGYYAYDLGSWRIYVLNSNCGKVGGCGAGSPQEDWLKADLDAHPQACIGAYWQTARFSSGRFGDDPRFQPFWQDLYDHGAEFVINGHDHNYQRYVAMTPTGLRDPAKGIREFIVGTGGNGHTALNTASVPNREAANDKAYGVLRLTLHPAGYEWQFLSTQKVPYNDAGADSCH
jgi:hypothetical protein